MKLKKFNEIYEASDPNDDVNKLTPKVKENVDRLLSDLKEVTKEYLIEQLSKQTLDNERSNSWNFIIKVPIEHNFSDYILDYIKANGEKYGVKIHIVRKERTTMLEFIDGDNLFLIPIITTMRGDDMIYPTNNKLEYGVWINTYVAEKVR